MVAVTSPSSGHKEQAQCHCPWLCTDQAADRTQAANAAPTLQAALSILPHMAPQ